MNRDRIVREMWVCVCCTLIHANGECCDSDDHGGDNRQPWSEVSFTDGYSVTMGMLAKEHAEGCTEDDREAGCDCEHRDFSWSRCDGCGSSLGGERYAFTLWRDALASVS